MLIHYTYCHQYFFRSFLDDCWNTALVACKLLALWSRSFSFESRFSTFNKVTLRQLRNKKTFSPHRYCSSWPPPPPAPASESAQAGRFRSFFTVLSNSVQWTKYIWTLTMSSFVVNSSFPPIFQQSLITTSADDWCDESYDGKRNPFLI